jgi:hypothetical protein
MTEEQQFDRVAKGAAEAIAWLCSNDGATFARAGRVTCLHRTSALCALILDASGRFDDAHPSWMNRVDDIIAAAGMAGEVSAAHLIMLGGTLLANAAALIEEEESE